MSEWKEYKFSELLVDESISYGVVQPGAPVATGVPIIRVNNIKHGKINADEVLSIAPEIELKYNRTRLRGGELLITVVGSVGECAIVPDELRGWNVARAVSVANIKPQFNKQFVRYSFLLDDVKFQMYGNTNDTVQPTLNLAELKNLRFTIPTIEVQNHIAEILSSLDDKIDLLHRQNKTLEEMAGVLWRKWFVEENNGYNDEICLKDIADHSKESINPSRFPDIIFDHYSLPAFDNGKFPESTLGVDILSNKYKVRTGSILVSKLNPRFPRIWGMNGDSINEHSICSTEFQVVLPKKSYYFEFIYCFLKSYRVTQELAGASSGTSGSHQRVNPEDIFNLTLGKPDEHRVRQFHGTTINYFDRIKLNDKTIRKAIALRDNLLPKLMSGEIKLTQDV